MTCSRREKSTSIERIGLFLNTLVFLGQRTDKSMSVSHLFLIQVEKEMRNASPKEILLISISLTGLPPPDTHCKVPFLTLSVPQRRVYSYPQGMPHGPSWISQSSISNPLNPGLECPNHYKMKKPTLFSAGSSFCRGGGIVHTRTACALPLTN